VPHSNDVLPHHDQSSSSILPVNYDQSSSNTSSVAAPRHSDSTIPTPSSTIPTPSSTIPTPSSTSNATSSLEDGEIEDEEREDVVMEGQVMAQEDTEMKEVVEAEEVPKKGNFHLLKDSCVDSFAESRKNKARKKMNKKKNMKRRMKKMGEKVKTPVKQNAYKDNDKVNDTVNEDEDFMEHLNKVKKILEHNSQQQQQQQQAPKQANNEHVHTSKPIPNNATNQNPPIPTLLHPPLLKVVPTNSTLNPNPTPSPKNSVLSSIFSSNPFLVSDVDDILVMMDDDMSKMKALASANKPPEIPSIPPEQQKEGPQRGQKRKNDAHPKRKKKKKKKNAKSSQQTEPVANGQDAKQTNKENPTHKRRWKDMSHLYVDLREKLKNEPSQPQPKVVVCSFYLEGKCHKVRLLIKTLNTCLHSFL
jgi:hypothetical protein